MRRRILRLLSIAAAVLLLSPAPGVGADAPGPTDYRSAVIAVDPPTPSIHPAVIGGDSFLELRVDAGVTVLVPGYQGEQYLRFEPDGTVLENRASATYALSGSRYGGALPDDFDAHAPEQWHKVAGDGRFAWHDHRIHWMTDVRPPGKRPGDVVLRNRIPMTVDEIEIEVTVQSVWMPAASSVPMWVGAGLGFAVALVVGLVRGSRWTEALLMLLAAVATVVGWWQYASLPTVTGPKLIWFLLPLVAAVAAGAMMLMRSMLYKSALLALSGVNLCLWGWLRRDGLTHAVLPTDAPGWLDRAMAAAALAAGPLVVVFGVAALASAVLAPSRSATSAT